MQIFAFDSISSTMKTAKELACSCYDDLFCVLATTQTHGIGTQARQWHSPIGNFYATFVLRYIPQDLLPKISLLTGITIAQTLKNYNIDVQLKWINDIMVNNKKVGGILCEYYQDILYVGIGINLRIKPIMKQSDGYFESDMINHDYDIDYSDFAKNLGQNLLNNITLLELQNFKTFIDLWSYYDAFYNKIIHILLPSNQVKIGINKGINHDACLLIQTQSCIEYFYSARITKVL